MKRHLPLCLIVGLLIFFRLLGAGLPASQPNFQPLAALFFCGAMLAPGWRGFALPLSIWAITLPFGSSYTYDLSAFLTALAGFSGMYFLGMQFAKRRMPAVLGGALVAAAVFHLITNGAAWVGSPLYSKDFHGLWQSLWTGPVSSEIPSWVFLRNLAAANLLFTGIFVGAQLGVPRLALTTAKPIKI
jgi:hypothetical protein